MTQQSINIMYTIAVSITILFKYSFTYIVKSFDVERPDIKSGNKRAKTLDPSCRPVPLTCSLCLRWEIIQHLVAVGWDNKCRFDCNTRASHPWLCGADFGPGGPISRAAPDLMRYFIRNL